MSKVVRASIAFLIALAGVGDVLNASAIQAQKEQTYFTEGRSLHEPVSLPAGALKALLETQEAQSGMAFSSELEKANPTKLFRAASVHLDESARADLLVIGVGFMSGADQGWFWIVDMDKDNPKVILFAPGSSIKLLNSRTHGHRDILSVWSGTNETSRTTYRFNGTKYELLKKVWMKN